MLKKGSLTFFLLAAFLLPLALREIAQDTGFSLIYEPISAKKVSPFIYYCLPHRGTLTDKKNVIGRFIQTMKNQNISPAGQIFGVFYNSLDELKPAKLRWEVGAAVTAQALPQKPLEKKNWEYTSVVCCLHIGPYERTEETIAKMLKWMELEHYSPAGPILERYIEMNSFQVKPEEQKTEIWIPYEKRGK